MDKKYQNFTKNDPSNSKFIFGDDLRKKTQTIKNNEFSPAPKRLEINNSSLTYAVLINITYNIIYDLCCLPCHVLFCGGDTNAPSSCFLQFNAL